MYFNIANINLCTTAEGPFKRMAIWFQGCNINCKQCCNPQLQSLELAHLVTIEELLKHTIEAKRKYNIEGITLTGGEPTLQANNLEEYCKQVKSLDLGIILFTGKLFEEVPTKITKYIDLVIDGRFDHTLMDSNYKFVGSRNQKLFFLTKRYNKILFKNNNEKIINIGFEFINGDPLVDTYPIK